MSRDISEVEELATLLDQARNKAMDNIALSAIVDDARLLNQLDELKIETISDLEKLIRSYHTTLSAATNKTVKSLLLDQARNKAMDNIALSAIVDDADLLNQLDELEIETFSDLERLKQNHPMLTSTAINKIVRFLRPFAARESPIISLPEVFSALSQRERDIIYDRYGLLREKLSLDSIGSVYGLTRERIRQLQNKTLDKLRRIEIITDPEIFSNLNSSAKKITPLSKVPILSNEYKNQGVIELFVDAFPEMGIAILEDEHLSEKLLLTGNKVVDTKKKINLLFNLLLAQEGAVLIEDVSRHLNLNKEIICLLKNTETNNNTIMHLKNKHIFMSVQDKVLDALKTSGKPMTISEIANQSQLNLNQVRGVVGRNWIGVVNIGRSTYALEEWGYKKGDSGKIIVDFLRQSGEPRTVSDILAFVKKYREVKDGSIYAALKLEPEIQQIDYSLYALKEWGIPINYTTKKQL